ncbi:hypothetical protein [Phreatobacter sp.]|uniref:hypothetical protein n=1 Tax=Phreatobacter sp. TaxID=1966341 RepID=UPI003F6FB285
MTITELGMTIADRGVITAEDVLALRRRVYGKGCVTDEDVEQVFALNDRLMALRDPEWPAFFVEALCDYLVDQAEPRGYVSEQNASWLVARISRSNRVDGPTELELLIRVLERAQSSPPELVSFALEQVRHGVVHGEGCIGRSRRLTPGVIGADEVELIRRILYAFGGDANIGITRQEAAVLLDINDMTAEAENHPSWSDLFVKALANFLMVTSGYQVPTRQEALRREAWLDAPTDGVRHFLGRMLTEGLADIMPAYGTPVPVVEAPAMVPDICSLNAAWIAKRVGQSGRLHPNEVALVNFLKSESPRLHPSLLALIDRA